MRMSALILTVLAVTLPMAPASSQDRVKPPVEELPPPEGLPQVKAQIEEPAKTVKELQKERIATLKQAADAIAALYKIRRAPYEEVLEARLLLHKAELDAAEKESDRITLYKNIVDELKEFEMFADKQFKAARWTVASFLKVKARRLEAQIDLERVKAKEAKKAK